MRAFIVVYVNDKRIAWSPAWRIWCREWGWYEEPFQSRKLVQEEADSLNAWHDRHHPH